MKGTISYLCSYLILFLSVVSFVTVSGCRLSEDAKIMNIVNGETGTIVSPSARRISVTCNGNPVFVLGAILAAAHESGAEGVPAVTLFMRDDAVLQVPRESRWTSDELISYHDGVRIDPRHQSWEYSAVDRLPFIDMCVQQESVDKLLRMVSLGVGYSMSRTPDSSSVLIGPAELIDGSTEFVRRVYHTSGWQQWGNLKKLPRQLCPCGAACAYDETGDLLVVIGERIHLNVFEMVLEALGARCIDGDDGEGW